MRLLTAPRRSWRQRALGQNFLADPNLLAAIVRDSGAGPEDVVLEVGAGGGALTERLAQRVSHLHAVEIDRRLESDLDDLARLPNVSLHWGDAMKLELGALDPAPTKVVSNLPYSIATPLLLKTLAELPEVASWTVMVQREIAERLRASPGSRQYGAPSVLLQLAAEVELGRRVDPAVFVPRPRVESAVVRMRRRGPAAPTAVRQLVRDAFTHRRKSLARSLELSRPGSLEATRSALAQLGQPPDARAESLAPKDFLRLAERLATGD
jgi:16S rRNA (adenine1518-N6/adenine1519-N6)-dimethyltransferase